MASVATLERYAGWLAGPGVERGLLGPREADRMWPRHLINCALVEPLIPTRGSICDLGSGRPAGRRAGVAAPRRSP